jgi:undecaprenyl-diphosphatase
MRPGVDTRRGFDTWGVNALARPALWLLISLAMVIAAGLGLHGLATLMPGEDLALVRGAAGDRTPFLTALAHGASWLGRSAVLVPAAIVIALVAALVRRPLPGLAVLAGVLGAILIQNVDKAIVARPRPPVHELEAVSGTSFPSGHATEATAFFLVLAVVLVSGSPPHRVRLLVAGTAIVIVAAIAVSRVYLGVHYPTDVVAGILLGGSWGVLTATTLGASGHSHVRS